MQITLHQFFGNTHELLEPGFTYLCFQQHCGQTSPGPVARYDFFVYVLLVVMDGGEGQTYEQWRRPRARAPARHAKIVESRARCWLFFGNTISSSGGQQNKQFSFERIGNRRAKGHNGAVCDAGGRLAAAGR